MEAIKLDITKVYNRISETDIQNLKIKAEKANKALDNKTGKGNDFLGWVNIPSSITQNDFIEIENTARRLQSQTDIILVIGIGGSYLDKKRYGIVVISKSGTTTEPAIAFRIFRGHLEKKVGAGKEKELIIAVTNKERGALHTIAKQKGYKTYVIPDGVGGRYSVLTPVGLVPLAIGGVDIRALVKGAADMEKMCSANVPFEKNPAALYAVTRYLLNQKGKKIEILANYENKLHYLAEWWKQLFGESEGKEGIGIYPASVDLTADLHSMGQYIQEGERMLFETVLSVQKTKYQLMVPTDIEDLDKLNYLAGKNIDYVNKMAELGTMLAHVDGDVPNIKIEIPEINPYYLGQLMYFFEKACGISGYLLGINPFDQPGVEAYKKNMFALLEKPGFEEATKKIKERL
jgi:glucose-6-phosphate isomerase